MSQPPLFSIVSPVYNRAHTVGRAIESVLKQDFESWELWIIDDGSTDGTDAVVAGYSDPRMRYIYQENQERSVARNRAISLAQGTYICFLDSDDYYLENHLSVLAAFLQQQGFPVGLTYTGGYKQRAEDVLAPNPDFDNEKFTHPIDYIIKHCLLINSVCAHKSIFDHHHFDPAYNSWEDTELWIRICAQFPFYYIPVYTTVAARDVRTETSGEEMLPRYAPRDWNWKLAGLKRRTLELPNVVQALGSSYASSYLSAWFFEFAISLLYARKYAAAAKAYGISLKNNPGTLLSRKTFSLGKALLLSFRKITPRR